MASEHQLSSRMSLLGTETAYAISAEAAAHREAGHPLHPFHIGDLNVPTPDCVKSALQGAIDSNKTGYCAAAGILPLRDAFASWMTKTRAVAFTADNVSIQPGGKPIIGKWLSALLNPGDEVLYPSPGYPIYESQINFLGGVPRPYTFIETDEGYTLDMNQLEGLISPKTKFFIYNNFHNPTGASSSPEEMARLAQLAVEHDWHVLSDEAYWDLVYDVVDKKSIVSLDGMKERTTILHTFSKSWSMTGWRLGAAVGPEWIITAINKLNSNAEACTCHPVQWAGIAALSEDGDAFVAELVGDLRQRRDVLVPLVNACPGLRAYSPPSTFYLFVNATEAVKLCGCDTVEQFRRLALAETGVSFCHREHFGAPLAGEDQLYVRFAYSGVSLEQIREGMEQLRAWLQAKVPQTEEDDSTSSSSSSDD